MRKIVRALAAMGIVLIAAGCAFFSALLLHAPVFAGGEAVQLYCGESSSSPVVCAPDPVLGKLLVRTRGESASYDGDRHAEIAEAFGARLLFTEETAGADGETIYHYYLYSPYLGKCVLLYGQAVNLHIAVRGTRTTAGTPLIFGSI